jgi:iron complex transport system ATP-binding protein
VEALALRGAEVTIGGRRILGPVDLVVGRGEHWVVLGPNGGGKTTLLELAGARRQPSRGEVWVLGERLGRVDVRRLRRRIGHVSHVLADRIRPSILVEELVVTGATGALEPWLQEPTPADRRRARALLELVGCAELARRPFSDCSSGERQRVLIARALVADPELLLLDEPAAGLDLPARELLIRAVESAASHRSATVLAVHHVEEIPRVVTHAALVRDGRVLDAGPVAGVLVSETLSACFGIPIEVGRSNGRWWARAAAEPSGVRAAAPGRRERAPEGGDREPEGEREGRDDPDDHEEHGRGAGVVGRSRPSDDRVHREGGPDEDDDERSDERRAERDDPGDRERQTRVLPHRRPA